MKFLLVSKNTRSALCARVTQAETFSFDLNMKHEASSIRTTGGTKDGRGRRDVKSPAEAPPLTPPLSLGWSLKLFNEGPHTRAHLYLVCVEERDSLMVQVFPKARASRWRKTLEAALILCFHRNRLHLEGWDGPVAGVQCLDSRINK